ncbi:hypothetical protein SAMN06295885_2400 [Rathayibacter oskolensis]|uniref:FAD:protein FMN transferase n=2 Tax=Rathayibacter oskolensis TaxID=1891671 RepID=A0A1X7P362_9MICO|nr:hypothetical protein SAMN06295885_2400 [Rathayibacter oskolensis]
MVRYRRLLGTALLVGLLPGALSGCSGSDGRALDAALSVDECVLASTTDSRPLPPFSRSSTAVFDVDVTASEECGVEQLTATAIVVAEAAAEALGGVPEWRASSEYTQRVGDDVFAVAGVHADAGAVVAALEGWDALRRDVDGRVSVRTFDGDATIDIDLVAGTDDTAAGVLARFLESGSSISRGIPEWTISVAGGARPSSEVVVHGERPAWELVGLAQQIDAAFTGATSMQLGATVLSFSVTGGGEGGRPLTDSALWPSVLSTMTAMTDRGSGYGIGGVVDAEAADGSGRVVDDFAAASTDCVAPPGGGATTRAAFEHLATVIRPAHPGESFPQAGLSAPACR